jgi:hypothetical protein
MGFRVAFSITGREREKRFAIPHPYSPENPEPRLMRRIEVFCHSSAFFSGEVSRRKSGN